VERSRFWLRRDDDDQARQVVYDQVQLDRYSERQRRAILKAMARGKTSSHRDISQAARRARTRTRGEILVATTLMLAGLTLVVIVFASWHRGAKRMAAAEAATARAGVAGARTTRPEDATTAMERADRAWLTDVGAGKVKYSNDGSDALSLPEAAPPDAAPERSIPRHRPAKPKTHE
jgi:hypothetical protein